MVVTPSLCSAAARRCSSRRTMAWSPSSAKTEPMESSTTRRASTAFTAASMRAISAAKS